MPEIDTRWLRHGVAGGLVAAAAAFVCAAPAGAQEAEAGVVAEAEAEAGAQGCALPPGGGCAVPGGRYHVLLPEGAGPFPVVLALHSSGQTGASLLEEPVYREVLQARGYAVIAPDGAPKRFADGSEAPGWYLRGTATAGRDEISFLEQVLNDAEAAFGIDRARVVVTGYGLGAALALEIACLSPETAGAYAPRNGGFFAALPEACAAPVRLIHLHAPVQGGWPLKEARTPEVDGAAAMMPVQGHMQLLAEAAGCGGTAPIEAGLPAGFQGVRWTDCADGAEIGLVAHDSRNRTTAAVMNLVLDWFDGAAGGAAAGPELATTDETAAEDATN
ncbi:MAG: hypothetical protein AAF074_10600 [Pseudomonadota bacterium]